MSVSIEDVLSEATVLDSGQPLDDIEVPFRVLAGPGAGKTHWLVEHIYNVIANSERLGPGQRIACISYTSVAAEEVQRRLGSAAVHVDVSTIHSFLYRNVVKPYLPWIKDDDQLPIVAYQHVDGHAPHQPQWSTTDRWIKDVTKVRSGLRAFDNLDDVFDYLRKLKWVWNADSESWSVGTRDWPPRGPFPSSVEKLMRYKPHYWQEGVIDHEDVLYFALEIMRTYPHLHRFLSARYPYLFVDEFQDTNPIQTAVLEGLAEAGTTTGVIGDIEQAIFVFAGAEPDDLLSFAPAGQETYWIRSNRRSTKSILQLLNHLRQGDEQTYHSEDGVEETGNDVAPTVLVGTPESARRFLQKQVGDHFQTLTRTNDMVRKLVGAELPEGTYDGVWDKLFGADVYKAEWLQATIEATHEAQSERYGQAAKILYSGLRTRHGKLLKKVFSTSGERYIQRESRRRIAASLLPFLLVEHDGHREMTGFEFYRAICSEMKVILPSTPMIVPRGTFKSFLDETSYEVLYATTLLDSGAGRIKTIHKAKGEEYPTVLAYRGAHKDGIDETINHLLGRTENEEERRVTYVALSRAEDRLYICIEELPDDVAGEFENMGLDIIRLQDQVVESDD